MLQYIRDSIVLGFLSNLTLDFKLEFGRWRSVTHETNLNNLSLSDNFPFLNKSKLQSYGRIVNYFWTFEARNMNSTGSSASGEFKSREMTKGSSRARSERC